MVPHSSGQLRVLQVVLSLRPGGTERLVVELVNRLHREIPMAVCCLDDEGDWARELCGSGVEIYALHRKPGFHPTLGRAVARAARRHRATVIHGHQYSPFVYACLARLWSPRCRIIFTEHGRLSDAPPSTKRRIANGLLSRVPHDVFAVSDDLRRHLTAEGFAADRVEVIYNGIDPGALPDSSGRTEIRQRLGLSKEITVLGTIARLDPVKDLGGLLRAVAHVSTDVPLTVLVIGDGPERQRLEALARELHMARSVRFLGHQEDARRWLAGCDLYVNSSVSEGVSLTILEAMAAGLPVIATRVGGTPEVVDESCGRLVPARDAGALAAAIRELAIDESLRHDLGRAARRRVGDRFTLDRMIDNYRDVYRGSN